MREDAVVRDGVPEPEAPLEGEADVVKLPLPEGACERERLPVIAACDALPDGETDPDAVPDGDDDKLCDGDADCDEVIESEKVLEAPLLGSEDVVWDCVADGAEDGVTLGVIVPLGVST